MSSTSYSQISAWERKLSTAASLPDQAGVPDGANKPRKVAVAIEKVNLDLTRVALLARMGEPGVNRQWNTIMNDILTADTACT